MCMTKSCSPRRSTGETSATTTSAIASRNEARRAGPARTCHQRRTYSTLPATTSSTTAGSIVHAASGEAASGGMTRLCQSAALAQPVRADNRRVLHAALALLVPPRCAVCGAPGLGAGEPLCAACRRALPWLGAALCERCALPSPCGTCAARGAAFAAAWAAVSYSGIARDAVRALKLSGARPLAGVMAAQIATGAPRALLCGTLVPVPAHPVRERARGFDPAALLTRALARRTGLPLLDALRRDGGGAARQVGAARDERLKPGRVGVHARCSAPAQVLLVDDVHTTGATLDACATCLREAGAQRVVALTWARTLRTLNIR